MIKTNSKIRAVIFDVDGTLVDTSDFIFEAYEHALAKHASPRTRKDIASQIGKRLEDCYAFLAPDDDHEQLMETHRIFQEENIGLVKAFEFCEAMLKTLQSQGLRLALYTSRTKHVEASLETAGIDPNLFEVILNGAMVSKGKPDPEGVHVILEKLELKPKEAVMVGDAAVDILLGKNAGLAQTIGITHGFGTREEIESAKPDVIIDSLQALPSAISKK